MTGRRILRTLREVALTLGAIVGVLCIALTLAGALFGVKPLLFRSGSMAPAIKTGDLAFSRTVDASALHPGDIVSVITSSGERVTHRLVSSAKQGDARQLKLKGDANKTPDAEIYTAVRVQRVMFNVPKLGYVVAAASSRVGVFVLGLYVALMLLLTFRRPRSDGPDRSPDDRPPPVSRPGRRAQRKRRRPFAKSTAALFVVTAALASPVLMAGPTWAAPWTDSVVVAGGTYKASVVPPPVTTCGGVSLGSVKITWDAVPGATSYTLHQGSGGATTETVDSGVTSKTLSGLISGGTFTVEANIAYGSNTWTSVASNAKNYSILLFLVGTCGNA